MRIVQADVIHFMVTYGSSDTRSARAAESRQLSGSGLFGVPKSPHRTTTLVFWQAALRRCNGEALVNWIPAYARNATRPTSCIVTARDTASRRTL